ncbi:MAG: hypothetical protein WC747_03365 [Candidatus Babeliales bacterium]|jgi:hypothetical protein
MVQRNTLFLVSLSIISLNAVASEVSDTNSRTQKIFDMIKRIQNRDQAAREAINQKVERARTADTEKDIKFISTINDWIDETVKANSRI